MPGTEWWCRTSLASAVRTSRSDREEYTFARHVEWTRELFFDHLDLVEITFFGQDWGSLIGLRLVGEHPERFARVAIGNGGLPTGDERMSDAFKAWQDFSQSTPELHIGNIVLGRLHAAPHRPTSWRPTTHRFPTRRYKEGCPPVPQVGADLTRRPRPRRQRRGVGGHSRQWDKPFLCCFSDGDAITKGGERNSCNTVPGTKGQAHTTIEGGGHFLQEESGPELAAVLNAFIEAN